MKADYWTFKCVILHYKVSSCRYRIKIESISCLAALIIEKGEHLCLIVTARSKHKSDFDLIYIVIVGSAGGKKGPVKIAVKTICVISRAVNELSVR